MNLCLKIESQACWVLTRPVDHSPVMVAYVNWVSRDPDPVLQRIVEWACVWQAALYHRWRQEEEGPTIEVTGDSTSSSSIIESQF